MLVVSLMFKYELLPPVLFEYGPGGLKVPLGFDKPPNGGGVLFPISNGGLARLGGLLLPISCGVPLKSIEGF